GNNHILKGTADAKAEGNIVLGFNTTKEESNFKVSGKNIVAVGNDIVATEDNSVYLGNGSKNATAGASKVMGEYNTDTINGITLNFAGGAPAGIVSVGSAGKERRIQNVAAGWISATSTDAINGSQLHSVINNMTTKIEALATPNVVVKGNGPITVTSVEENKEKVFTVGVTLGEITSTTGGRASTANEAGLVTSGSVVAAVNALGSNTIKLEGDSGKTDGQNLNKENGLTFGIKGSGLVKTEAKGTDVIIDLSDEVKEKLNNVETSTSSANSGVASAVAMANLPQVSNIAGHRHNIAGAYGYYNGEHAFALGISGLNETGNLVYKASGSLNTKG
ncbi:YadA-like family protein, partial [Streptobacillus canis]|uniref:YadA-like family protein n=1 Tax=Streptobacillus canis TaxID=2678686 RepID=UPI001E4CE976